MSGTIVWFQLDLRLDDQPALAFAAAAGEPVIPVHCHDPRREGRWAAGGASRWWLHRSLAALDGVLQAKGSRLTLRTGDAVRELLAVAKETGATGIAFTARHEPWARDMERELQQAAAPRGVALHRFQSALLFDPQAIRTDGGLAYKVFTPFWKRCLAQAPPPAAAPAPRRLAAPASWPAGASLQDLRLLDGRPWIEGLAAQWTPGEAGGAALVRRFLDGSLEGYESARDRPSEPGTSRLSPHLHFGEISPRRLWHAIDARRRAAAPSLHASVEKFRDELGWREFAHHVLTHFPRTAEEPLRPEFRRFPWSDRPEHLRAWRRGRTGYPLVDAGMRQLRATGWMHNRVRMVVASFLVKHLRQHWLRGAEWFWNELVDADLASNTMGWQWSAGCGADAAPYFRIFNPVLQGERFDPGGDYVRRWVPELAALPARFIHAPWTAPAGELRAAGVVLGEHYPRPIVDHAAARAEALAALAAVSGAEGSTHE
jgi:deoxyribodipyrimidine photo-lyase